MSFEKPIHAGQCFYHSKCSKTRIYEKIVPLSKAVFDPSYPMQTSSFAKQVRKARMDAGLEIKELAKAIGVHEMTVVNWEQGRTRPRNIEAIRESLIKVGGPNIAEFAPNN